MLFCKKCGTKLEESAKFCPKCGTPVTQTSPFENTDNKQQVKTVKRASHIYGKINLEDLPAGYIIDDRYEIKEKLGQGGFGAVYRAYDKKMNIDKALKVIPEEITNDIEAMTDLQNEAKTMIKLNHPNIVRVYDFHDTGRIKYIDMEYIDGKTLTEIKLEHPNKQIEEEEVKKLALKIADGLAYAHNISVIHKDIKPQNVMVTKDNKVKIMDFGIADTVRTSMSRIQNTSSSGTLVYMSPEQLRGKDVGKESDIYSFGAMLYELLSGHPPFYRGDINYQILNEKPEEIDSISAKMNGLLIKCLEKNYKDRYRAFEEVFEYLEGKEVDYKSVFIKDDSYLQDKENIFLKTCLNAKRNKKKSIYIFIVWSILSFIFILPTFRSFEDWIFWPNLLLFISAIIIMVKRLKTISWICLFFYFFVGIFFQLAIIMTVVEMMEDYSGITIFILYILFMIFLIIRKKKLNKILKK